MNPPTPRIPCVGAVVVHDSRLLVVRRANAPGAGLWSIPGGRVEVGETPAAAVVREVAEETGLRVEAGRVVGTVERAAPSGGVYVIDDLECSVVGAASAYAGSDASEVAWVSAADLAELPCVDLLVETLRGWGVLDRLT